MTELDPVQVSAHTRKKPDPSNVKQPDPPKVDDKSKVAVHDKGGPRTGVKVLSKSEGGDARQTTIETSVRGPVRTSHDDKRHA